MSRVIPVSLALTCSILYFSDLNAQDFEACMPIECEIEKLTKPNCTRQIFPFMRFQDPVCEANWVSNEHRAQLEYESCQIRAKIAQTRCESLKAAKNDASRLRSDGEACTGRTDCESGYCLPGPSLQPATSTTKRGGDELWFCVNASANCAQPDTGGGFYGDRLVFEGAELMCQDPGNGLWAQYFSPLP